MPLIAKLLIIHFVADFLFQPREMGKKKSSHWGWLFAHTGIQFLLFLPFTSPQFALANCLIHGVIDRFIWQAYKVLVKRRLEVSTTAEGHVSVKTAHPLMTNKGEWQYWEDHLFYSFIGFDQLLHALTLVFLAEHFL